MAARGVRFTDFYARHKCSPARASLMSGAYNFRVGIGSIVYPHSSVGMCKETVTIPEMLNEKGYTSALVGAASGPCCRLFADGPRLRLSTSKNGN